MGVRVPLFAWFFYVFLFRVDMDKLMAGVRKFRDELGRYQKIFRRVAKEGQSPHTLFITCCDSRIHAEWITQSQLGELFVVKNIGNIVPPSTLLSVTNSTAAAIEFAVEVLGVEHIVICGHSGCGAIEALLRGLPDRKKMPHLCDWLALASPVQEAMLQTSAHVTDEAERSTVAAQKNVLCGLENLCTYPAVSSRLAENKLQLHGWFFKIATAEVFAYDKQSGQFLSTHAGI